MSYMYNVIDAARRFFQSLMEKQSLEEKGKYDAKVQQQRRRNRISNVSEIIVPN